MNQFINYLCGVEDKRARLSQLLFCFSLFFLMCYTELRNFLITWFDHVSTILFIITYGFLILSFITTNRRKIAKNKILQLLIIVGFLLTYFCGTFLLHPEYEKILFGPFTIKDNILFPMSAVWTMFFFCWDVDVQIILKTLFIVACTRFLFLVYSAREVIKGGYWKLDELTLSGNVIEVTHTYNINWAYKLFTVNAIFLIMYFRSKNKLLLIPIAIGQVLILLYGSRGSFFMLFVFGIICVLFCNKRTKMSKRIIFLLCILIILLILFSSGLFTKLLYEIILKTGITSRTLTMFLNGEITSDSGRNLIYKKAFEMIKDFRIFGYGIYGDRYHILSIGQIATNGYGYVHNVFLELVITFGAFGIIIICIGIKRLTSEIVFGTDFDLKCLFLICFGCSLNLLISSSYWYQYYFWALIGLIIRTSKTKFFSGRLQKHGGIGLSQNK